jgi:hypothetical protein
MYKSKFEIQRKLKQVNFALKELMKYRNKVFVNNGKDLETGCYPFEIRLGTFLIFARSIFQYAHKEAVSSGDSVKRNAYEQHINANKIFKYFKDLRDDEVHSLAVSFHVTISFSSPIHFDKQPNVIESKASNIKYEIAKRLEFDNELVEEFERNGQTDMADALRNGKPVFETKEFEGQSDIFDLAQDYYDGIVSFVEQGISTGLIS